MELGIKRKVNYLLACLEGSFRLSGMRAAEESNDWHAYDCYGKWFIDCDDMASFVYTDEGKVLNSADLCIRHEFNILGTGLVSWGERINWHQDVITRRVWPLHYYKRLFYNLTGIKGSDVKIPWELSRFQHLPTLVQAYHISRDGRFCEEAVRELADWIESNPFLYGINWTCAMEVAIRACNWILAWWAFKEDPAWTDEFNGRFLNSLWQHGLYIEHNLEDKGGIRTNHYLSDVVGLLFLGVMFPQFRNAGRWRDFGVKELVRCMEEMVYPDGVSFENSTAYHRLVLELFAYSAILCKRNEVELIQAFWERLEKMFEFVMYCKRPDGHMPMVGDSDDGRFFIFSDYYDWDRWDHRYLMAVGAVLFRRRDLKEAAGSYHQEIAWLFGKEGVAAWQNL